MLKTIRIILAVISFIAITLLFVDVTGLADACWPWMAKIQFIPALLSLNAAALIFLLLLTLLLGRVYCSVICPLGITQDIINWLRGQIGAKGKRKNRFRYALAWTRTRLVVLTIFAVLLVLGLSSLLAASIASLIEPYSAFGRIATQIFAPIYVAINNLMAGWSESAGNYVFAKAVAAISIPILAIAIITLVTIVVMAWRGGRDYCNTICPVGTILGYLSKYSLLKPVINTDKCINCGKCARNCKAKCINAKAHAIDYSRCVACMDCISTCQEGAIAYTWRRYDKPSTEKHDDKGVDSSRRAFMASSAVVAGAIASKTFAKKIQKTTDGGLTPLKNRKSHERDKKIVPPGAISVNNLASRCTACQQCIQSCPSHVLKPSVSLDSFMQPRMDFNEGYCWVGCNTCSQLCPTGAIQPIGVEEKSSTKIGTAVVDINVCISASKGENCGNCAKRCPAQAITMVPVTEGSDHMMPVIDENLCIGCGACEYHCPVGTIASMESETSAIHVEGALQHRTI